MTTLRETLESEQAKAEVVYNDLKAEYVTKLEAAAAEIAGIKANLANFTPWLGHELADAKALMLAFFGRFGL